MEKRYVIISIILSFLTCALSSSPYVGAGAMFKGDMQKCRSAVSDDEDGWTDVCQYDLTEHDDSCTAIEDEAKWLREWCMWFDDSLSLPNSESQQPVGNIDAVSAEWQNCVDSFVPESTSTPCHSLKLTGPNGKDTSCGRLSECNLHVGQATDEQHRRFDEIMPDLEQLASQSLLLLATVLKGKLDYLGNLAYSMLLDIYASTPGPHLLQFLCADYATDRAAHVTAIKRYLELAIALVVKHGAIKPCYLAEYLEIFSIYPSIQVVKLFAPVISAQFKYRLVADLLNLPFETSDQSVQAILLAIKTFDTEFAVMISDFMVTSTRLRLNPVSARKIKLRNEKIMRAGQFFEYFSRVNTVKFGTVADLEALGQAKIISLLDRCRDNPMAFMNLGSVIWNRMESEQDIRRFWSDFCAKNHNDSKSSVTRFLAEPESYWRTIPQDSEYFCKYIAPYIHYARGVSRSLRGDQILSGFFLYTGSVVPELPHSAEKVQYLNQIVLIACERGDDYHAVALVSPLLSAAAALNLWGAALKRLFLSPIWLGQAADLLLKHAAIITGACRDARIAIFNRIVFDALVTGKKPVLDAVKNHSERIGLMSIALAKGAIPPPFMLQFFDALCDWSALNQQSLKEFLESLICGCQELTAMSALPYGVTVEGLMALFAAKVRN